MGCCGQKRSQPPGVMPATLRPAWLAPVLQRLDPHPASTGDGLAQAMHGPAAVARGVLLRYRERARVLVRGPVSGRHYEFSAEQPNQVVEARDVEALLLTRYFMRA